MSEDQTNYQRTETSTSGWAIVSLIAGIGNYIGFPVIGAVIALISGYIGKSDIEKSHGRLDGENLAKAGIILGWVGIVLALLSLCLSILAIVGVIGGSIALCGPFGNWLQSVPTY